MVSRVYERTVGQVRIEAQALKPTWAPPKSENYGTLGGFQVSRVEGVGFWPISPPTLRGTVKSTQRAPVHLTYGIYPKDINYSEDSKSCISLSTLYRGKFLSSESSDHARF